MNLTIEKIHDYRKTRTLLDKACKKYFKSTAPDWRIYQGWDLSENHPDHIKLCYSYYDWRGEYENGYEYISIDVLIKFIENVTN